MKVIYAPSISLIVQVSVVTKSIPRLSAKNLHVDRKVLPMLQYDN